MTHHLHQLFYCALLCLIIQALSSCSVQKRRYRHGFYVSTRSKVQESEPVVRQQSDNIVTTKSSGAPIVAMNSIAATSGSTSVEAEKKKSVQGSVVVPLAKYIYKRIEISPRSSHLENKKLRPERIGFVTALLAFLLSIFTIFISGMRFAEYGPTVLLIICVALALVALYNCAKVIVEEAGQEQKRKGYWMAVAGLVICTLCFLFWADVVLTGDVFR